jgi:hypothetical protein
MRTLLHWECPFEVGERQRPSGPATRLCLVYVVYSVVWLEEDLEYGQNSESGKRLSAGGFRRGPQWRCHFEKTWMKVVFTTHFEVLVLERKSWTLL